MVAIRPTLKLSATFTAYKGDTVRWEDGRIVEGEKLWEKGKNSCVILSRARMTMLWQLFCFGETFYRDTSGMPLHRESRCAPFQYMQLGDGTENTDSWWDDLVHPLMEDGQTYGYTKFHDHNSDHCDDVNERYKEGSWRLSDAEDVKPYDEDTTCVTYWQWYNFGIEHACDSTITEWGLFTTTKHFFPCPDPDNTAYIVDARIRRYLNRNHLEPVEQFYKDTNMIIRAMVKIEMGF